MTFDPYEPITYTPRELDALPSDPVIKTALTQDTTVWVRSATLSWGSIYGERLSSTELLALFPGDTPFIQLWPVRQAETIPDTGGSGDTVIDDVVTPGGDTIVDEVLPPLTGGGGSIVDDI